jgi:hypothetical protein
MLDGAARAVRMAALAFLALAAVAAVAAAVLVALGLGTDFGLGGILGGAAAGVGALAYLAAGLTFARLGRNLLHVFTPEERAAALRCRAEVLGARATWSKINRHRVWRLRLRVTPPGGAPYEIERVAPLNAYTGERLARGDMSFPCLVDPDDRGRIELVVRRRPTDDG